MMHRRSWQRLCLVLLILALRGSDGLASNRSDAVLDMYLNYDESTEDYTTNGNACSVRLHASLEKLRKRRTPLTTSGFIDLSGYALHQTLRHAPLDMYVTDIKVRTPGTGNWARVEKCHFADNRLVAQLLFNDLVVTGNVRLFEENSVLKNPGQPVPTEFCSMTVRLKRAGLGINAFPARGRARGIEVRTEARFVDPNYLSVHAYGCKVTGHQSRQFDGDQAPPGIRIITLVPGMDNAETVQLHREDESDLNNYHKDRILSVKFQNERDKLKAVLHVKNLIAQQANQVFQAHGPFSQIQSIAFHRPVAKPVSIVSSITELDENLTPIRPVPQQQVQHQPPVEMFFSDKIVSHHPDLHSEDLSREMEDMFLRGIKTLLTKYLEKQLEMPLKEALMVSIGYTVSYG